MSLHLAIFQEPYLGFVMEGRKTIETRFAKRACPPYQRVSDGDVLMLKRAGGKIIGITFVEKVWFYRVDPDSLHIIRMKFGDAICAVDESFWQTRQTTAFATLIKISQVAPVENIEIEKRDRRGWVVFDAPSPELF